MSTDYKVDASLFQLFYYLLLLFGSTVSAEELYIHGEVLETAQSRLIVLIRKDCGRRKYRALLARKDTFHGSSESYLGLAKANVSAEKSLHRTGALHISLYLRYGGELIVGLHIGETLLEIALYLVIGIEGKSHALFALCVKGDELMSHILYGAFNVAACFLPLARAELVQLNAAVVAGTDIFRHHIQLGYGYIELIRTCVLYGYIVLGNAVHFKLAYADKASDTMTRMYYKVALGNVRKGAYLLCLVLLFAALSAD